MVVESDKLVVLRVWGKSAMFANPHLKGEPYSEPFIPPSAINGILRSIYWKPEFEWEIVFAQLQSAIQYENRRIKGLGDKGLWDTDQTRRVLQSYTSLRHVEYVIGARIVMNKYRPNLGISKYIGESFRRMSKGEQFRQPYFGRREHVALWELIDEIPTPLPISMPLGPLLLNLKPIDMKKDLWEPVFFRGRLDQGVLNIPRELYEPHRDQLMQERHRVHGGRHVA